MANVKEIMSSEQVIRTLKRITHEIIERNQDLNDIVLVGILKKGYPIAKILKENLMKFAGIEVDCYPLDISNYRDDRIDNESNQQNSVKNFHIEKKTVILVDDVLYTGRSVRAAMDALIDYGRPSKIQFAVLVDRGHRELPIRADYIGKNIPTSSSEKVFVNTTDFSVDIRD
ncbi:MAG: bifunctional pyr operon transcriptional regulator/uracil phosphoribosyltransferase PyrR [Bacilli bacterium]